LGRPVGPRVAVIVDDIAVRRLLTRHLESAGYGVIAVPECDNGLRAVQEHQPDLLLVDLSSAFECHELCRLLRQDSRTASLPIVAITANPSIDVLVTTLDAGADDFLARPFSPVELLARIRRLLRNRQVALRMEQAQAIVAALVNTVAAKDQKLRTHSENMAHRAARLATLAGLAGDELDAVAYGALLHDIGKIAVPQEFLDRPGPLDPVEMELMRQHPVYGSSICDPLRLSSAVGPIIRHHHEWWDGSGYPTGLRGERIPVGSRIVAIADAYDAIVSGRPYRPARSLDEAIDELRRCAGTQFDPLLVPMFVDVVEQVDRGAVPRIDVPIIAVVEHALPVVREGLAGSMGIA
jgi:putative two-component system response regulator